MKNGAVPGTHSGYMSLCVRWHVPEDADLVLVRAVAVHAPWSSMLPCPADGAGTTTRAHARGDTYRLRAVQGNRFTACPCVSTRSFSDSVAYQAHCHCAHKHTGHACKVEYGVNDGNPDHCMFLTTAIRRAYERLLRRLLRFRNRPAVVHLAMQSYEFRTETGERRAARPLHLLRMKQRRTITVPALMAAETSHF